MMAAKASRSSARSASRRWPWRSTPVAPPLARAPAPAASLRSQSLLMRAGLYIFNIIDNHANTQLVSKQLMIKEVSNCSG